MAGDLVAAIERSWQAPPAHRFVVLTGGEPLLQADATLVDLLHARGFEVAVETNGTLDAPPGIDWICVSPKSRDGLRLRSGQRAEAGLSAGRGAARGVRGFRLRALLRCSRWTGRHCQRTPRAPSPIAWPIRNGNSACRHTSTWEFADVRSDRSAQGLRSQGRSDGLHRRQCHARGGRRDRRQRQHLVRCHPAR